MSDHHVDLGKTDNQVREAVDGALDAIHKMISDVDISHTGHRKAGDARDRDVAMALCLDPAKILAEFDRLRNLALAVGEDDDLVVTIDTAKNHLSGWKGGAADAFREHMERMKVFAHTTQQEAFRWALQQLGQLFNLAYHMRQSYCDLAAMVTSAALHEIDEHHERIAKVKLAIGKELVKGALSLSPGKVMEVAIDAFVESAAAFIDYGIEGTGIDAVVDGWDAHSGQLWATFEHNLNRFTRLLSDEHGRQENTVNPRLEVLKPINQVSKGITDVGSPNFSYANFYTEEYPKGGPFARQVAEERPKYAEEKHRSDPKINRRLEGLE